jgi:hypothetical protein
LILSKDASRFNAPLNTQTTQTNFDLWKPRSRRSVTIAQKNLIHLREHRKEQAIIRLKKGAAWQAYDLVFSTREGKPIQACNILRRHLRPILK